MENKNEGKKEGNLEEKDKNLKANKDAPIKPDPETIQKTDPQDEMEGPVSSLINKSSKLMESDTSKEEATKKRDDRL